MSDPHKEKLAVEHGRPMGEKAPPPAESELRDLVRTRPQEAGCTR